MSAAAEWGQNDETLRVGGHRCVLDRERLDRCGAAATGRDGCEHTSIRERVLPPALQYQLVSNYTSLVTVDRTRRALTVKSGALLWRRQAVAPCSKRSHSNGLAR